ncbi:MAG: LuxR C-terminal-related transcriptional regulator [Acidimicrobiia bacterium]
MASPLHAVDGPNRLTARQLAVLELMITGAPDTEIAAALVVSRRTVETHVQDILRKLGARNRTEAAYRVLTGAAACECGRTVAGLGDGLAPTAVSEACA